jgi:hypothetical protein
VNRGPMGRAKAAREGLAIVANQFSIRMGVIARPVILPHSLQGICLRLQATAAAEMNWCAMRTNSADELGGSAPIPTILAGGERAVQRGNP